MSYKIIEIDKDTLPLDWIKQVKNFSIDDSNLGEHNKILVKKLQAYILKYKENSLMNKEIKYLISHIIYNTKFENLVIEHLETKFIIKVFDELRNEENYHFNLKLQSLYMEIATMYRYAQKGYVFDNIEYNEGNADLTLKKGTQLFELQVKHKQSNDDFLDSIEEYIKGKSILNDYKYLQNNEYHLSINKNSLDDSERKKSWQEVESFLESKNMSFQGKYITINNKSEQVHGTLIDEDTLTDKEEAENLINKIILRVIVKLDKQYKDRCKDKVFIGVIIWSIPFNMDSDFQLIQKKMEEIIKVPYHLDITLTVSLFSEKKHFNFILSPSLIKNDEE